MLYFRLELLEADNSLSDFLPNPTGERQEPKEKARQRLQGLADRSADGLGCRNTPTAYFKATGVAERGESPSLKKL